MTVTGVDYSFTRPNLDTLKGQGYGFVMRYLSWLPNIKCIDASEVAALRSRGFAIGLNWEYAAGDMKYGAAYGKIQGSEAVRQAKTLGYPMGCCIYYSADFDATLTDLVNIDAYLGAVRNEHAGYYRIGVYGGFDVVKHCLDNAVAHIGWQTYAWSGGRWDERAAIRQVQNGVSIGGGDCDINSLTGNACLWTPNLTPTPPSPLPKPVTGQVYKVVPGDTLSAIAHRFGVTVEYLATTNHIANPNLIFPGQVLYVGSPVVKGYYTVRKGDTLTSIAAKYGTSWSKLALYNGIANPNLIYIGQVIRIP